MERHEYTDGLRKLADLLDSNEKIPLPFWGREFAGLTIYPSSQNAAKEELGELARALSDVKKTYENGRFELVGKLGGLWIEASTSREAVCTKRVVGTKTITREITDPEAPKITIVEEVDDVEWDCEPLLAPSVAVAE